MGIWLLCWEKDKQTKLEAHEALLSALKTNANTNIHEELQPMKDLVAALEAKENESRADLDRLTGLKNVLDRPAQLPQ